MEEQIEQLADNINDQFVISAERNLVEGKILESAAAQVDVLPKLLTTCEV